MQKSFRCICSQTVILTFSDVTWLSTDSKIFSHSIPYSENWFSHFSSEWCSMQFFLRNSSWINLNVSTSNLTLACNLEMKIVSCNFPNLVIVVITVADLAKRVFKIMKTRGRLENSRPAIVYRRPQVLYGAPNFTASYAMLCHVLVCKFVTMALTKQIL